MRKQLNNTEIELLKMSAGDLIPMLEADVESNQLKQLSFQYFSKKCGEFFQIHLTVTRDNKEFKNTSEIERMIKRVPKKQKISKNTIKKD